MGIMKDITTDPQRGSYLSRVQRGVIVQIKGKRGPWFVVERDGSGKRDTVTLYVQRWDGEKQQTRASRVRGGEYDAKYRDRYAKGVQQFAAKDVTHIQVSERPRRRRRY